MLVKEVEYRRRRSAWPLSADDCRASPGCQRSRLRSRFARGLLLSETRSAVWSPTA